MSGFWGDLPPVSVFEPDDVVELRRRDLQDRRVLERRHTVDGSWAEVECGARRQHLRLEHGVARGAELQLRATALDEPGLVLLSVELQAQRLPSLHEQDFPDVALRLGPDELVAPGLVDLPRLHEPGVEAAKIWWGDAHRAT